MITVRDEAIAPVSAPLPSRVRVVVDRGAAAVRVFVTVAAMRRAWRAVGTRWLALERGGFLVGRYGADAQREERFIVINDVVPAVDAAASAVHIELAPAHWRAVHEYLAAHPGRRVLGWYHSHAHGWVGMSSTDRRTQRLLFDVDWQVGLVLAPGTGRFRFYQGRDAEPAAAVALVAGDA